MWVAPEINQAPIFFFILIQDFIETKLRTNEFPFRSKINWQCSEVTLPGQWNECENVKTRFHAGSLMAKLRKWKTVAYKKRDNTFCISGDRMLICFPNKKRVETVLVNRLHGDLKSFPSKSKYTQVNCNLPETLVLHQWSKNSIHKLTCYSYQEFWLANSVFITETKLHHISCIWWNVNYTCILYCLSSGGIPGEFLCTSTQTNYLSYLKCSFFIA